MQQNNKIDYKVEIEKLLREYMFDESWMSEQDWKEFLVELLKQQGTNMEELAKQCEIGVQNGYSLETQFQFAKKVSDVTK